MVDDAVHTEYTDVACSEREQWCVTTRTLTEWHTQTRLLLLQVARSREDDPDTWYVQFNGVQQKAVTESE
jgi:hypothetical protein